MGAKSGYSNEEILSGFTAVDRHLGSDFIESHWKGQRGIAAVAEIVALGLNLEAIRNTPGLNKLLGKLHNKRSYNIAASELKIGAFFGRKGLLERIYPFNPNNRKELDFKLKSKDGATAFVEVVSPRTLVSERYLMQIADKLSKVVKKLPNTRLEVYLFDLLSGRDLSLLYRECVRLLRQGRLGIQTTEEGKYIISLSYVDEEKMSKLEKKKRDEESILFVTNFSQKAGIKNVVTVGVPLPIKELLRYWRESTTNWSTAARILSPLMFRECLRALKTGRD